MKIQLVILSVFTSFSLSVYAAIDDPGNTNDQSSPYSESYDYSVELLNNK